MGQRDCAPLKTYVQGSIILMKTQGRLCCLVNSHEKQEPSHVSFILIVIPLFSAENPGSLNSYKAAQYVHGLLFLLRSPAAHCLDRYACQSDGD